MYISINSQFASRPYSLKIPFLSVFLRFLNDNTLHGSPQKETLCRSTSGTQRVVDKIKSKKCGWKTKKKKKSVEVTISRKGGWWEEEDAGGVVQNPQTGLLYRKQMFRFRFLYSFYFFIFLFNFIYFTIMKSFSQPLKIQTSGATLLCTHKLYRTAFNYLQ